MSMFKIDIPSDIDHNNKLEDWVRQNQKLFYLAMNLDSSEYDPRATIENIEEDVEIMDVEIDEKTVKISYRYTYYSYYGCKDIDYSDTSSGDVIIGNIEHNNTLLFEAFESTVWVFPSWDEGDPRPVRFVRSQK